MSTTTTRPTAIGVASYGALGHMPLNFQLFNFSGHFGAAQSLTFDSMWLPIQKNILAYTSVTVYCMDFIIFLRVTLKLFSLSFVTLLAPHSGDASGYMYTATTTALLQQVRLHLPLQLITNSTDCSPPLTFKKYIKTYLSSLSF